ncbi:MAG: flagellar export chaperone FliS [Synergistetes bacterium]|nr:flagellar export chaperone FliS [Synergistota bacterium]MCX8128197.1 flagellar export chaperone FliS [Synergistota bacterium]MDW8192573.1 flagellar export chaperone FliS [Synergistota bacterium]
MNVYEQYKQTQVQTAKPEQLLLMLYDGAINFLKKAKKAIEDKNIPEAHTFLIKTQDIIIELMVSLNMEVGEIAMNLFRLYEYMHYRLVEANVNKDVKPVDEVLKMLQDLRDAWDMAIKKMREGKAEETSPKPLKGGFNIAG